MLPGWCMNSMEKEEGIPDNVIREELGGFIKPNCGTHI